MDPLISAGIGLVWHNVRRTIGVVCVILVLGGLGWAVYAGIIRPTTKPNPTTTQIAKHDFHVTNIYREDAKFWGIKLGPLKLGLDFPQKEKLVERREDNVDKAVSK